MTFTHPPTPPAGNHTVLDVALWTARDRSGDNRDTPAAKPDEAWYAVLEEGASVVTKVPLTELTKRSPVAVAQVMYRPYAAAASHIRFTIFKIRSAGKTQFGELEEAALALEAYQASLDAAYGLEGGVVSGTAARTTPMVRV